MPKQSAYYSKNLLISTPADFLSHKAPHIQPPDSGISQKRAGAALRAEGMPSPSPHTETDHFHP